MLMPTAPHNAVPDVRLNIRGASNTKKTALCNIFSTNTRSTVSKTAKNRKKTECNKSCRSEAEKQL